jgi:hypothetical protein
VVYRFAEKSIRKIKYKNINIIHGYLGFSIKDHYNGYIGASILDYYIAYIRDSNIDHYIGYLYKGLDPRRL